MWIWIPAGALGGGKKIIFAISEGWHGNKSADWDSEQGFEPWLNLALTQCDHSAKVDFNSTIFFFRRFERSFVEFFRQAAAIGKTDHGSDGGGERGVEKRRKLRSTTMI